MRGLPTRQAEGCRVETNASLSLPEYFYPIASSDIVVK